VRNCRGKKVAAVPGIARKIRLFFKPQAIAAFLFPAMECDAAFQKLFTQLFTKSAPTFAKMNANNG
jgi:hypothetical protein